MTFNILTLLNDLSPMQNSLCAAHWKEGSFSQCSAKLKEVITGISGVKPPLAMQFFFPVVLGNFPAKTITKSYQGISVHRARAGHCES